MNINIKKMKYNAHIPSYGSDYSAGCDLYACIDNSIVIKPQETVFIPTGIALEIPVGYGGFIYARSSVATKRGLAPANKVGVIDSDYRGEIIVALYNQSDKDQTIEHDDRIAQLVIAPFLKAQFVEVDILPDTKRDTKGFGSTGR